jgi:hypothetical protein
MKCYRCILAAMKEQDFDTAGLAAVSERVRPADTVFGGMAVCVRHLLEEMELQ